METSWDKGLVGMDDLSGIAGSMAFWFIWFTELKGSLPPNIRCLDILGENNNIHMCTHKWKFKTKKVISVGQNEEKM